MNNNKDNRTPTEGSMRTLNGLLYNQSECTNSIDLENDDYI